MLYPDPCVDSTDLADPCTDGIDLTDPYADLDDTMSPVPTPIWPRSQQCLVTCSHGDKTTEITTILCHLIQFQHDRDLTKPIASECWRDLTTGQPSLNGPSLQYTCRPIQDWQQLGGLTAFPQGKGLHNTGAAHIRDGQGSNSPWHQCGFIIVNPSSFVVSRKLLQHCNLRFTSVR